MFEPLALAAAYGIAVEVADLGTWAGIRLISEYDPRARAIRVNARALDEYRRGGAGLTSREVRAFIDLAVAHEVYHHREACGELPRLASRALREAAADRYARSRVPVDDRLDGFVTSRAAR